MYTFYLDDSYQDQSSIMTIAGYIQSDEDWSVFEANAEEVYNEFDVDELHTMDFHGTKGCFKGWSYKKKKLFLQKLFGGSPQVFGVSQSVQHGLADSLSKNTIISGFSDYSIAFTNIISGMVNHPIRFKQLTEIGLRIVVEAGNKHDGGIQQEFERLQNFSGYDKILREFKFSTKSGSKAIQLSDLLAFYSRRHRAKLLKYGKDVTEKISVAHQEKLYTLITSFGPHISSVASNENYRFVEVPDDNEGPLGSVVNHPETKHMSIHAKPPEDP